MSQDRRQALNSVTGIATTGVAASVPKDCALNSSKANHLRLLVK